jgi:para-nitrobenzyl esterase
MKKLFTLISCSLFAVGVYAQADCTGGRYMTENLFSTVDVTNGVTFGNNNAVGGGPVDLKMDVYEPAGDTETGRAVVIMQFGGSFIGGQRSDVASQCQFFAKMGYVAIAPDYRVGLFFPSEVTTTLAVMRAMHDMKACVRYLKKTVAEDGNPYGIDPERIIVGGISAGAIGAIHAAYLDEISEVPSYMENDTAGLGGVEGNSGTPGYSSDVIGVLSYSGAIGDSSWINSGDAPIISVHEDQDNVVPFNTTEVAVSGIPTGLIASGSRDIHARARNVGIDNCLYAFEGVQNHVGYLSGGFNPDVKAAVIDFCGNLVCGNTSNCAETQWVGIGDYQVRTIGVYPNPANEVLKFRTDEVGTVEIIDATGRTVLSASAALGQNQLDIADLPRGAYVMMFSGSTIGTARFIKD